MFEEPEPRSSGPLSSRDWEAIVPTRLMRGAALSVMSLGVFCFALGVQLSWLAEEGLSERTLGMFAAGLVPFGYGYWMRGRIGSFQLALASLVGLGFVVLGGRWLLSILDTQIISRLAFALPVHGVLTALLCLAALVPARRVAAARARIRAAGFDV